MTTLVCSLSLFQIAFIPSNTLSLSFQFVGVTQITLCSAYGSLMLRHHTDQSKSKLLQMLYLCPTPKSLKPCNPALSTPKQGARAQHWQPDYLYSLPELMFKRGLFCCGLKLHVCILTPRWQYQGLRQSGGHTHHKEW